jgi:hypothetical protein
VTIHRVDLDALERQGWRILTPETALVSGEVTA